MLKYPEVWWNLSITLYLNLLAVSWSIFQISCMVLLIIYCISWFPFRKEKISSIYLKTIIKKYFHEKNLKTYSILTMTLSQILKNGECIHEILLCFLTSVLRHISALAEEKLKKHYNVTFPKFQWRVNILIVSRYCSFSVEDTRHYMQTFSINLIKILYINKIT